MLPMERNRPVFEVTPMQLKFEDRSSRRDLQDKSDALAEMRGNLPGEFISSKRKTKLHSIHLLRSGLFRSHPH